MDDYALVLNAGSSSLKFCVYQRPTAERWRLEARGQIEGIGTSPRFSAKDGDGEIARRSTARRGRCAMGARRSMPWPPGFARSIGGARVLGVGHRVVHGGARFAGPAIVTPASSGRAARADAAGPSPSAAQSRRHRSRRRAACRACRRSPASTPAFIAASRPSPSWCRCRARSASAACSGTGSMACRTNTSRRFCRRWRRRSPTGASSSLTWAAAPACAR